MNTQHHKEQMEAVRRDFGKVWRDDVIPKLRYLRVNQKDLPALEHACWICFKAGQQTHQPRLPHAD